MVFRSSATERVRSNFNQWKGERFNLNFMSSYHEYEPDENSCWSPCPSASWSLMTCWCQLSTILAVAEQLRGNDSGGQTERMQPAFIWVLRDMQLKMVGSFWILARFLYFIWSQFSTLWWCLMKKLDPKSEMVLLPMHIWLKKYAPVTVILKKYRSQN